MLTHVQSERQPFEAKCGNLFHWDYWNSSHLCFILLLCVRGCSNNPSNFGLELHSDALDLIARRAAGHNVRSLLQQFSGTSANEANDQLMLAT